MKNNSIFKLLKLLIENRKEIKVPIPSYWLYPLNNSDGKFLISNPYDLLISLIENFILKNKNSKNKFKIPVIYGSFIRTTTAFDFDNDNKLLLEDKYGLRETGTILRMFFLLPILKKIGINMLYLLPITLSSELYKKGEAPSPYSAKNFLKLDKYLYDPMTGEFSEEKLELQFKAFVEACHILGIKVVLDFIPRTASRDNDLILEHPDWFYWIKKEYEKDFKPPKIEGLPMTSFFPEHTEKIYTSTEVKEFLKKFVFAPNILNPKKWEKLVKKIKKEKINNFLSLIESEFEVTTVPGFSDVINDTQPLWTDVTFLRLYLDFPKDAEKYLSKNQPPYVLFDIIKASRINCKKPNKPLWNYITNILPYYQKKFNIDGVRIDMGHALPAKLEKKIIENSLKLDKNFYLIAEELDPNGSKRAKESGYHSIIGNLWAIEPRWNQGLIKEFFLNTLPKLSVPVYACAETPDTPRAITREGKEKFHLFATALNFFLPNTITFINSGFELKEIQPLNKGLDTEFCNLYLLSKNDLNYGKLGLFYFTSLHWNNNSEKIFKLLEYCNKVKSEYPEIFDFKKLKILDIKPENKWTFGYYLTKSENRLYVIINTNLKKKFKINFKCDKEFKEINSILSTSVYQKKNYFIDKRLRSRIKFKEGKYFLKLRKGEIIIFSCS